MQLGVFPFCFLLCHSGGSSLVSAYRNKRNERSSECVFGSFVFFSSFLFVEGGEKEAKEKIICGMGKERGENKSLR